MLAMGGDRTRPRLLIGILALLLLASGAALTAAAFRIDSLSEDLTAAENKLKALPPSPTADGTERTSLEAALTGAEREIAELRRRLRDAQTCADQHGSYGGPHVWAVPDHGPPGTRVTIVGDCFKSRDWNFGYGIFLIRHFFKPQECEVIAGADPFELEVDRQGRSQGFFTVPSRGGCFQHDYDRRVTPGVYRIGIGCHACATAAAFRVTRSGGSPT